MVARLQLMKNAFLSYLYLLSCGGVFCGAWRLSSIPDVSNIARPWLYSLRVESASGVGPGKAGRARVAPSGASSVCAFRRGDGACVPSEVFEEVESEEEEAQSGGVWIPSDLPEQSHMFLREAVRVLSDKKVEDVFAFVRCSEFRRREAQLEHELLLLGQRGFRKGPRRKPIPRLKRKKLALLNASRSPTWERPQNSQESPHARLEGEDHRRENPPSPSSQQSPLLLSPDTPLQCVFKRGIDGLARDSVWFPVQGEEAEEAGEEKETDWRKRVVHEAPFEVFLLATGLSPVHLDSLAEAVIQGLETRFPGSFNARDGFGFSGWVVLRFGQILVHLMTPVTRRRYSIEELHFEFPAIDLRPITPQNAHFQLRAID